MVQPSYRPDSCVAGIELKNIHKSFDRVEVLRDLSLTVRQGELLCLLGPSGCGKTTALKIINGLLEADSGSIYIGGNDYTYVDPQKRNLGMVFQNYALFPQMNVADNIAYGLKRRKLKADVVKEKVTSILALVRLQGIEKRRIHELSGGQQQRVALARALVIEPWALLLDEPLSNLDAKLREDMREEIKRIQRQLGITAIYVTHDQEEAMSIADRIVVMNAGKIEQIGTPQEVYHNPETMFVAAFIGKMNFITGHITNRTLSLLGHTYDLTGKIDMTDGVVTCAIRPERINLVSNITPFSTGLVESISYLGSVLIYEVSVNDNRTLHELEVQAPVSQKSWNVGDTVNLDIDFNNIRLFRD
jgi:ABC-type Fe3+/spermidine/putrescine transport system ATPase subunit